MKVSRSQYRDKRLSEPHARPGLLERGEPNSASVPHLVFFSLYKSSIAAAYLKN